MLSEIIRDIIESLVEIYVSTNGQQNREYSPET